MVKILLVEDNPLNQDMLSRRLARQGYEVAVAIDGAAGLSMAKTELPDLILMDMNIPIIDGWEATRQLKADGKTHSIPIVALTAHAMIGDREKAIAAGCDDYATKPVEFKQLLKTIRAFTTEDRTASDRVVSDKTAPAAPTSSLQPLYQAADLRVEQTPYAAPPKNMRLRMASAIPEAEPEPIINPVSHPASHPFLGQANVPAPPQASDANSNNAFTLLVVNDNITNRKVLSAHLQRKGYTVVSADSPRSALTILQEFSIDLVLLDIMTPDDGNLNTLQKIRETYPKTILAVVLITVNDSDEEVVRAFDMGANDYVTKPINLAIVMARIKAQLETLQATRPQSSLASAASHHQRSLSSQPRADLGKAARLPSEGPTSLEPAHTHASGPSPLLPTMPAVPTATPVPLTGQFSLSDRRAAQQVNQRADRRAVQRDKQQTIQPLVKQTTDSLIGTHLRTKSYLLNHVFSQSGLAKVTLQNNPEPEGSAFCLVETFSPDIKSERLFADLKAVIEEVRSPLKTISQHERIAEVLNFFNQSDSFGWVQAYSEGHLFSEEIGPQQRTSAQATGQVIKDILEVLLPFHAQGIVHSSIQPQHLWRSHPSGRVMLINLGLSQRLCAYLANHAIENRKAFTVEHDYMPIEQRIGHPVLSSDLYAVGLIALQCLTGQTTSDLTNMLLSNSLAIANIPTMTPELAQVLSKMLPQEPSERYLSAREALQAVNAIVAN